MFTNSKYQGIRIAFVVLILLTLAKDGECSFKEKKKLRSKLLTNYDSAIIPIQNMSTPLDVHFHVQILKVRFFKTKEQTLSIATFTSMAWHDSQLKWNRSDFGGIKKINFSPTEIWIPDVNLMNTASSENEDVTDIYTSKVQVFSTGQVILIANVIWSSFCQTDITWFPVDKQECQLQYCPKSHTTSELQLKPWSRQKDLINNYYVPNGEWEIKATKTNYSDIGFDAYIEPLSCMTYKIEFDHLSLFYFIYILIPLIGLCFLFLLVFQIPRNSGERLGFGVTILLSVTVYLLVISDKLPEKSDSHPMLGILFTIVFFVLCAGLAVAAFNIKVGEIETQRPPLWLLRCSRVTCQDCRQTKENKDGDVEDDHPTKTEETNKEQDFSATWDEIADKIDRFSFIIFTCLLIILPIIAALSLNKDGLQ